jgi:hydroxyacylglutathione hydrolase
MWQSLMKLAQLPGKTRLYCGHDYTVENYEFALTIEPGNTDVKERLAEVKAMSNSHKPTVPSTIYQQRKLNPFLRADTTQIKEAIAMPQSPAVEIFAELRRRKDIF